MFLTHGPYALPQIQDLCILNCNVEEGVTLQRRLTFLPACGAFVLANADDC